MIKPSEIDAKSKEFDIDVVNVQRDYIFGWLLSGIYSVSSLKDILILKGGNALRKAYFCSTRFSSDLDFTTENGVDSHMLIQEFNTVCKYIQEKTGVVFDLNKNRIADEHMINEWKKVYKVRLYFRDFYGNQEEVIISVRVDITEFDKIYLPTQTRMLIHPYSDIEECRVQIKCIKLEEAMADKLKCLLQRRSSFDLFDLVRTVFIKNELAVDKGEIVGTFLKKTIFQSSPVVAKNLLLGIPLDFFKSFWDKHIICPKDSRIPFDSAIEAFRNGLDGLFGEHTYGQGNALAFFPSDLRNPILKAGSERTLLKVTYKGKDRMVEPYSLAYKRRKDGLSQEYLYVFDRTDSADRNPKSFVNTNFTSLENTTEKFEPRWEVELSKAGETNGKTYFGKPFEGRIRNRLRRASSRPSRTINRIRGYGSGYTIQCSYCMKKFKRETYNTHLNKHKDKYGNNCFGRIGYLA